MTKKVTSRTLPTVERLRELFDYDGATGELRWRSRHRCSHLAGKIAGALDGDGYWRVQADGHSYRVHRIIYALVMGYWPDGELDHRDLNRLNNRFNNLRTATDAQNVWNRGRRKTNRSGRKGVHWHKTNRMWRVKIGVNGQDIVVGYFHNLDEAAAAYAQAALKWHGEYARTS